MLFGKGNEYFYAIFNLNFSFKFVIKRAVPINSKLRVN